MSENCKSLILQDKCNIEIFLSPDIEISFVAILDKILSSKRIIKALIWH